MCLHLNDLKTPSDLLSFGVCPRVICLCHDRHTCISNRLSSNKVHLFPIRNRAKTRQMLKKMRQQGSSYDDVDMYFIFTHVDVSSQVFLQNSSIFKWLLVFTPSIGLKVLCALSKCDLWPGHLVRLVLPVSALFYVKRSSGQENLTEHQLSCQFKENERRM